MAFENDLSRDALPEEFFINLMDKDNLTKSWWLISTPYPVVGILCVYLLLVLRLGRQFMASRKPYEITTAMRLYNLFQVLYNGFMLMIAVQNSHAIPYIIKKSCSVHEDEGHENLKQVYLTYGWHFLFSKILDLLDTVFMVLRKKNSHVTFLHVYHHVAMVFFVWFTFMYTKSHHAVLPAIINITVHTIMYGYYFLSTFPRLKERLWWKKHLTKLQLGQFVVILLYISLLYYKGCPMSRLFTYVWMFNVFVILLLFVDFYIKAYMLRSAATRDLSHAKQC